MDRYTLKNTEKTAMLCKNSCDFSASLLQASVSQNHSCMVISELLLLLSVENGCVFLFMWKP